MTKRLERGQLGKLRRARTQKRPASRVHHVEFVGVPVAIGAGVTEWRDRCDDELWKRGRQLRACESETIALRGRDVVHEQVRVGEQRIERIAILLRREVE